MPKKVDSSKQILSAAVNTTKQEGVSVAPIARPSFCNEIDSFVLNMESISRANHQTTKVVKISADDIKKKFDALLKDKAVILKSEDEEATYQIKPQDAVVFGKRLKELRSSLIALKKIPETFFCSLLHQYDAFLGRMLGSHST